MGKVIHLRNAGITAVSLGPSTVTAAGGYALDASASLTVPLDDLSPLYAVAASGMVTVHVLEVGV